MTIDDSPWADEILRVVAAELELMVLDADGRFRRDEAATSLVGLGEGGCPQSLQFAARRPEERIGEHAAEERNIRGECRHNHATAPPGQSAAGQDG